MVNYKNFVLNYKILFKKNKLINKLLVYLMLGVIINIFVGFFYFLLLYCNFNTFISLSISYVFGVICSIYFNKNLTFNFKEKNSNIWLRFILLHILCYFICQITNQVILILLDQFKYALLIGFIISIGLAASTNFIGMYLIIKHEKKKIKKY
jgi:putative flippase GtrA